MSKLQNALFLITLLAFTSCGKSPDSPAPASVSKDGSCTDAYVTDYTNLKNEIYITRNMIDQYIANRDLEQQLLKVDSACENFLTNHGTEISCTTSNNGNGKRLLNGKKFLAPCKQAKDLLKRL